MAVRDLSLALAASSSTGIQSDEFNAPVLDENVWTYVDPLEDTTLSMSGTHAVIAVPEGARHDLWTGVDEVPRLVQAAPNGDFEVEVKFDSAATAGFQMQGLLVLQDAANLMRLEVHSDGTGTHLFIAGVTDGTASTVHYSDVPGGAPVYLRLKRAGDYWSASHSNTGDAWTAAPWFHRAMTVTGIGPFAGNSGSPPPAFTASIDYFREITPAPPAADTTPPAISGSSAVPSATAASITWTTDESARSRVDFGPTTAYGSSDSDDALRTSHSFTISGLSCATTYHFEIRSTDEAGNEARSGDQTFTTGACPTALVSDEFDSSNLDTSLWTYIDPVGDTTLSMNGTQAVMSLPAGSRHDLWTGADEVPRLLQAAPNGNFEVEVKFDTAVTAGYQMQGLLVQEDASNLMRLEVHSDGGGTRLFVAGVTGGVAGTIHYSTVADGAPVYLRLERAGDNWTFSHSKDGSSWGSISFTKAMTVRALGPFAGNSGNSPPAFEARVDYFRYFPPDVTPPQMSEIGATEGPIAAEVVWTTDELATSTVAFGETPAYENGTASSPGMAESHHVVLHGLRCETTYHYQVRSQDAKGNSAASSDHTLSTSSCPTSVASDEFDATSLDSDLWVFFDPLGDATASVNGTQAVISVPAGTAHDVWTGSDTVPRLLQPAPNTDFEVEAKFDSLVTTRYQQQGIIVEGGGGNLLRVEMHAENAETKLFVASIIDGTADVKFNGVVAGGAPSYLSVKRTGTAWSVGYSTDAETWTSIGFTLSLAPSAIGPFVGNGGPSPPAFSAEIDHFRAIPPPPPDTTPPPITSVTALEHQVTATVTWSTDEAATSRIDWGATTAYGQPPVTASEAVTAHRLRLTGLTCATTYHYRVRSTDEAGNEAVSADRTLTTGSCTSGPSIVVWRGNSQTFGTVGVPQRWVNVLGNVEDPDGIGSLSYRLNGGQLQPLSIGPTDDRLVFPGDFNVEVHHGDLLPGSNEVEIRATDTAGNTTVRQVQVQWEGHSEATPSPDGPVLVVVAHPDDEGLGMAGVIRHARTAGRKVVVAIATNGDSGSPAVAETYCGAAAGPESSAAAHGLRRDGETAAAMGLLGLDWTPNLATTDIIYLGYPDGRLRDIAASGTPWEGDATGLHRTYAEDFDGSTETCNGDFRYLLDGQHSQLYAGALAADLEALLDVTEPSDVYTHAEFDGHPDHEKLASALTAAIVRKGLTVRVHKTLIHPEGTEFCQPLSAEQWPNPALEDNDPFARFTPTQTFTAPSTPVCDSNATGSSWGPLGPPDELVEVPAEMQAETEAENLKWQVISRYETQIDCTPPNYAVTCGYMRAFVKRHEFFWTRTYSPPKAWPMPYAAQWTSGSSVSQLAQVLDGQWTYDGQGIRPVSTGFDRLVTLGAMDWVDYDVTAPITFNSFDQSRPTVGSGAGIALGWQGHSDWGQPRFGHPTGGLCLYAWDVANPAFFKLQIGHSPGPANDTLVASTLMNLPLGVPHLMRFRELDLGNGATRYSCKVWRSDKPEPSGWTIEGDVPYWTGETGTHPGSVVLVAHMSDATFGDVSVTPVGD